MAKRKRIEAELELPEEVIQHIQSFLNEKKAAQSTFFSKSWYAAWLTRPNLDFDEDNSQRSPTRFLKFIKKTVERYETLNLKIDSLRLRIHGTYRENKYSNAHVRELIMKALKMGTTSLDFKMKESRRLTLDHEVFGSNNLVKLSLSGCRIGSWEDGKVRCSRLKSLTLERVRLESDTILWDIISSCPLIENLCLSIYKCYYVRTLIPCTEFGKQNVGLFNKLKSLMLFGNDMDALFSHDFSSKFPCLKDLSLHGCGSYKAILVSSPSLECISFFQCQILTAKFDVPSIRKFTCSGEIPSVSFKTASTNWRSDISIEKPLFPNGTWILMMNKLLTELSQSKVSLSLDENLKFDCAKVIEVLHKPEVENLIIERRPSLYLNPPNPDLLNALFLCFRPIYVTQQWFEYRPWFPSYRPSNCDFMKFVYKRVMQHVGLKCSSASQSTSDLEEVDVEFFDEAISAWRPRLVDDSTCPGANEQRIRLHLRWRS